MQYRDPALMETPYSRSLAVRDPVNHSVARVHATFRALRAEHATLLAKAATLELDLRAVIERSRDLVWWARVHPLIRPIAGSSELALDDVPLTAAVLSRFCAGTLPTSRASQVWAGESRGETCDVCDKPIPPRAIEYEVNIVSLGVFRFHQPCFDLWNRERAWYLEHRSQRTTALAEAVWALLESHRGQMFCAKCLAEILGVARRIDRALTSVEGWGGGRHYARCSLCGRDRLVCGLTAETTTRIS